MPGSDRYYYVQELNENQGGEGDSNNLQKSLIKQIQTHQENHRRLKQRLPQPNQENLKRNVFTSLH